MSLTDVFVTLCFSNIVIVAVVGNTIVLWIVLGLLCVVYLKKMLVLCFEIM